MIKTQLWINRTLSCALIVLMTIPHIGCQTACRKMEPTIFCPLHVECVTELPTPFSSLSPDEEKEEWAKELIYGNAFAKEWDLYRAITCYKRGLFLIPDCNIQRKQQLEYGIILSYYLGNKYQDCLNQFEKGSLSQAGPDFPAFNNLLLIVYDCYLMTKQEDKASCVMQAIQIYSPDTTEDLWLYEGLKSGDVDQVRGSILQHRDKEELMKEFAAYDQNVKSPRRARMLNAVLPGAGYYYVGEKKSALTSFIINTLFTAAAYQFFRKGYTAAGAITTSLELGWYLGGINGAGIEAEEYNTRLFEGIGRTMLTRNKAFPILMFETSF